MRTVLIGAVESSATALRALRDTGHPPELVVTLDPEAGRRRHSDYVDLGVLAGPGTELLHSADANDPALISRLNALAPDFIFVIGWSQIFGAAARAAAKRFAIGFHPTALPLHRGRAPLAWTILLGLEETGSSLFVLEDGVDSGPILAQERFPVDQRETIASLMEKHLAALDRMMRTLVPQLASGEWQKQAQNEKAASYCAGRKPEDGLIDWTQSAAAIDRLIRATSRPYPGAFTFTRKRRVTLWQARPVTLPNPYFGQTGQIVHQIEGRPVVLCGDGGFIELIEYETDDGKPLNGQPRFFQHPVKE